MPTYEFEIQNLIKVTREGETAEEARTNLIDNLSDYSDEMLDGSCYVSDGKLKED
jgi:hypothetical protein